MAGLSTEDNRISEREAMVEEQLVFRGDQLSHRFYSRF